MIFVDDVAPLALSSSDLQLALGQSVAQYEMNHDMLERSHFSADSGTSSHLKKWRRGWEDGRLGLSA